MSQTPEKSYTCLIIDDEMHGHGTLSFHMKSYPQLTCCGNAHNPLEGLALIKKLKPDIIFLNVLMPIMTGIEMLDHFSTGDHYIILTSALDPDTISDSRANDFLRVPVTSRRFAGAVQRFHAHFAED